MLKAGFIGMGRMGITHFSILNNHPSVEIVAVVDKSKILMNIFKKYINVATYSDYQEMIEENNLDFVIISTPSGSHAEIIKFGLDHDLHIFVEKPFSLDVDQGRDLVNLAENKKLVNQVGYVGRFHDVFLEIKRHLNECLIGEIKHFKAEMLGATISKDPKSSWRGKKNLGGGCLYEFSAHSIDLIINLIGKPDIVKGSSFQSVYSSGVEDIVTATFLYHNGITGSVLANWSDLSYRKPTNRIEILGKNGKIIADQYSYKVFLEKDNEENNLVKGWNTRYITDLAESVRFDVRGRSYTRQLDYFIDCMENGSVDNIANFAEAFKTDEVLNAIAVDALKSPQEYSDKLRALSSYQPNIQKLTFWGKFKTFFRNLFN